jgi:hypothetical protein
LLNTIGEFNFYILLFNFSFKSSCFYNKINSLHQVYLDRLNFLDVHVMLIQKWANSSVSKYP